MKLTIKKKIWHTTEEYDHKSDNYKKVRYDGPDNDGGFEAEITVTNHTPKTIKYVYVGLGVLNRVGDVVCSYTVTVTGPINPEQQRIETGHVRGNASAVVSVDVLGASITYMDGTEEEVPLSELETTKASGSGGCYVATCVYGSYDCPEVWTLRRYRDDTLGATWYGRTFIRMYYAVSPTLVKWFGKTKWFKRLWQGKLDRMVKRLQEKGVESTPYQDKDW